jgi:hypothetical protein
VSGDTGRNPRLGGGVCGAGVLLDGLGEVAGRPGDRRRRVVELVGEPGGQRAQLGHLVGLTQPGLGLAPSAEKHVEHRPRRRAAGVEQRIELAFLDRDERGVGASPRRGHPRRIFEQGHLADHLAWVPNGEEHVAAGDC